MMYLTVAYTGLRASELASLTIASIDLTSEPATVTVEAAYSKHRKRDELPLHPELTTRLRQWLAGNRSLLDETRDIIRINGFTEEETEAPLWPGQWGNKTRWC